MSSLLHQLFPQGIQPTAYRQLKRLPQQMHSLLTAVAVAGSNVDSELVKALIQQTEDAFSFERWLVQCVSAAILEIEDEQIRFANEELRQILVDALDQDKKNDWHEKIALGLAAAYGEDPVYAADQAFHWQQVGNDVMEQKFARLAGEFAIEQYAYDTAVQHLTRALELTSETDLPQQYRLLLAREKVLHIQGNRDAQKDDLIQMAEIADKLSQGEQEWRGEAALRLGAFAEVIGEYTVAIVAATEALRIAQATQQIAHEAASYLLWGQALLRRGHYAEAQEKLTLSHSLAVTNQLAQIEADSLRFQGVGAADQGKFDQAKAKYEAALRIYQSLQDKRSESTVLNNLSIVAYSQNQLMQAMTHWERARQVNETIGDKEGMARILSNLSAVCLDLGEYEKGQAFSQEALAICRESDLRFGQGMNLINLSLFSFYLGADQQAEIYSLAALELAQEIKSLPLEGLALKDRAYLMLRREQWAEATRLYQQALVIWQKLAQTLQILEVQAGLGKAALAQGDVVQIDERIQPLLAHWQETGSFAGTSRPFFVYLTFVQLLTIEGDARATELLAQAHEQLKQFADNIEDPLQKQSFLMGVSEHRQILALVQ